MASSWRAGTSGWDGVWTADGNRFDFTKPYPDYDLDGLARYATDRGVRIIGHHETSGAVESYEQQMGGSLRPMSEAGYSSGQDRLCQPRP